MYITIKGINYNITDKVESKSDGYAGISFLVDNTDYATVKRIFPSVTDFTITNVYLDDEGNEQTETVAYTGYSYNGLEESVDNNITVRFNKISKTSSELYEELSVLVNDMDQAVEFLLLNS